MQNVLFWTALFFEHFSAQRVMGMKYGPEHIINGKYKLLASVGNGTMGEVYKAEHLTIHKTVAVKILHQNMTTNPEVIERFKREAQAAAAIEESHVCAVMDFDVTEEGDFYLVMEYLEGETLLQRIQNEGKLSPHNAVGIMQQLLSVLQCAHDHGIVHRDVKPENIILINRDNIPDFVKLLDFGIAHQDESFCVQSNDSNLKTQLGYLYGTPQYLSPEQATGSEIDYRADLYSCGIVLYEMLTGTVPFQNPSTLKVLHMQAYDPPPHLPVDEIECGQQFDEIIQKLLEKEPENRFSSAQTLREALSQLPLSVNGLNTWGSISLSLKAANLSDMSLNSVGASSSGNLSDPELVVRRWLFGLTRKHFIILIVTVALVLLLTGVVITLYFVNQSAEPEVTGQANSDALSEQDARKPQPLEFMNSDFAFSYDPVLLSESTMTKALEEFNADRFDECLQTLDSVYDRYKGHPNYLRLRLLVLDKQKNREEAVKAFIELCQIEPRAPLNLSVRTALYNIVEDKANHKASMETLKAAATPLLALSLSEAILQTPYDRHDIRRDRLAAIYEAMPIDALPKWRRLAVEAWTKVDKDKCEKRQELILEAYQPQEMDDKALADFYISLILPLHDNVLKLCKKRNKSVDCNACMRDWIDEQYEVLTNRLAGRPEPFLKDIEKIPETKRSQDGEDAKPDDDKKADETDDETQNKETGASSGNGKTSSSSKSFENAFKKRLSAAFSG